jgi:hypothetical protein
MTMTPDAYKSKNLRVSARLRERWQRWLRRTMVIRLRQRNIVSALRKRPKWLSLETIGTRRLAPRSSICSKNTRIYSPRSFSEMKGIAWSLGAMKIQLKPDAKSVKRRPYLLNPKYKEKVRKKLDRMLDAGIIVLVKESDWISPMVVQPKKTCNI